MNFRCHECVCQDNNDDSVDDEKYHVAAAKTPVNDGKTSADVAGNKSANGSVKISGNVDGKTYEDDISGTVESSVDVADESITAIIHRKYVESSVESVAMNHRRSRQSSVDVPGETYFDDASETSEDIVGENFVEVIRRKPVESAASDADGKSVNVEKSPNVEKSENVASKTSANVEKSPNVASKTSSNVASKTSANVEKPPNVAIEKSENIEKSPNVASKSSANVASKTSPNVASKTSVNVAGEKSENVEKSPNVASKSSPNVASKTSPNVAGKTSVNVAGEKSPIAGETSKMESKSQVTFTIGDNQPLVADLTAPGHENPSSGQRSIIVGVCAMSKKSVSKPMHEILERLKKFEKIQIYLFPEQVILNDVIEEWPVVDVLISFFSTGFPLDKAIAYYKLRKPYVINDLATQYTLMDRRKVYTILMKEEIGHPRYAVLNRENNQVMCDVHETEDSIEIDGMVFQKPFVEKPVDAEDHNVNIYFPMAAGGGSTRLFRKVKDRSSFYSPMNRVRKSGSFIYEDFMPTDGTDVKVYTVGPDYAHAEARKSPALDGKVERDGEGKEIRYPVLLSAKEKMIAKKVCLAFKQNICGFDLLRANGESYVCDVNGFSFVKTSSKYYDDCAKILGTMITRALAPQLQLQIPWVLGAAPEDIPVVPTTSGPMMELRCVSAIIRHGDRTPKQKMKMEVKHTKFFELFEKYGGFRTSHLKLKKPKQLQEVLDIVRFLLNQNKAYVDPEVEEKRAKLQQLKLVLEMYGHFSGINRKVQLKYQPMGRPKRSSSEEGDPGEQVELVEDNWHDRIDEVPREPSLVLIVKWGGELTPAGRIQAEDLGKAFRTLYPGGQGHVRVPGGWTGSTASQDHPKYWILDNSPGQFVDSPGLGFLRLHSTFRHDLKIYASDEGRVQMTAAAFTKGLLALEGELTPILIQMVKSANNNGLLDGEGKTSKHQLYVKEKLKDLLNEDTNFTEEHYKKLATTNNISIVNAMKFVENPRRMCERVHNMIHEITTKIRSLKLQLQKRDLKLYHGESWELLIRRWAKLEKDFKMKNNRFDISKIPDIYDCIKYDLQHNQRTLQFERAEEMFMCAKALADIVIPQEYGISIEEKMHIAQSYCMPLMRKIRSDLLQCVNQHPGSNDDMDTTRLDSRYSKGVASPERFVRTRLYFTSESHIHSLLTMLRYGGLCDQKSDDQWRRAMDFLSATAELNYMTQIVIMLFEDPSKDVSSDDRFHMELHFSPGAYTCCDTGMALPQGMGYRPNPKSDKNDGPYDECPLRGSASWQNNRQLDGTKGKVSQPKSLSLDEELSESDIFEQCSHHDKKTKESQEKADTDENKESEWDWDFDDDKQKSSDKDKPADSIPIKSKSNKSVSMPIEISPGSHTSSFTGFAESNSLGFEDKRSRSLEDKNCEPDPEKKRSRSLEDKKSESDSESAYLPMKRSVIGSILLSGLSCSLGYFPFQPVVHNWFIKCCAYVQRNYKTVHLPLASEKHHHSFSSLFYLNQDAYKGLYCTSNQMGSASFPDLMADQLHQDLAFCGFDMVPSLHPLETLHNALTFRQMDYFLSRATTTHFVTPVSSPPYGLQMTIVPRALSEMPPDKANTWNSLPSSSNSSGGPSSPTNPVSTPIDIIQKLRIFMAEYANQDTQPDFDNNKQ